MLFADKFWACVAQGDGCWEWIAGRGQGGYGRVRRGPDVLWAHRVAYELAVGPIPEGMCVCHRCDNPPCCNPAHLFLGTASVNHRDKLSKRRHPHGDGHYARRLTEADVLALRADPPSSHKAMCDAAARYGVVESVIRRAVRGQTWRHLPGGAPPIRASAAHPHRNTEPYHTEVR